MDLDELREREKPAAKKLKKPAAKKRDEYGRAFDDDQTLDEIKAAVSAPKVTCKLIAKLLREAAAKRL